MNLKEAILKSPGPRSIKEYITLYVDGFMMGIADLIPGVSGGTIAFIVGIYENLLHAISSLSFDVFKDILKGEFKEAISLIHVRFLATLILGMLTAIFTLAHLMHYLITEYPTPTWGFFFGLIIASIIVIFKKLETHGVQSISFVVLGTAFAYMVVGLIPVQTPNGLWFIYLCGFIGVSAMILPGLSGSFLLLILGKYEFITSCIKMPFAPGNMTIILVFAAGVLTSLLTFCKFLDYLITKYYGQTVAFLIGILVGSLRKVWPWKEVLETIIIRGKTRVLRDHNIFPNELSQEVLLTVCLMLIGFLVVISMEFICGKNETVGLNNA